MNKCFHSHLRTAVTSAFVILMAGCTVGPQFRPSATLDSVALEPKPTSDNSIAALRSDPVPANWWTLFNDDTLTALQARAQSANLDLHAASARVAQSRAQLGIAGAQLLPRAGLAAGYARSALSADDPLAILGLSTAPYELWQAGFDASWEIDLWGRARRARQAAWASVQATLFEREAVRVSVSAEVARSYLMLRGIQTQLDIARQNQAVAEHSLRLARNREKHGVATRFDTAAAAAELASINALVPQLEQQCDASMNALSLLLAEPPRTLDAELTQTSPPPSLPVQVPVGLSSELARRRPDILRAEARLHAATAAIGIAQADFYPRISLTGSLGVLALTGEDLGNWSSRQFSVGPTIHLPIFEGGRLRGTLALTQAQQQAAAIAYQQTVLTAWHEIDNALHAYAAERRRHEALLAAFEHNQQALGVAQRSYQEGVADYLTVLIAQRSVLASQTVLAESRTAASVALVALYKALGGGWDPSSTVDVLDPISAAGLARSNTQP